jgi:hypothetical protein
MVVGLLTGDPQASHHVGGGVKIPDAFFDVVYLQRDLDPVAKLEPTRLDGKVDRRIG